MSARCTGVDTQFELFNFLFGVALGEKLLNVADNLSKGLQSKDLSAAQGQHMAAVTVATLKGLRCIDGFVSFCRMVIEKQCSVDVSEPTLPRRSKVLRRYDIGMSFGHFPPNIEDHYRPIYYEAIDTLVQCITKCFDQPCFKVCSHLETLLLKGAKGANYDVELSSVQDLYQSDFDTHLLKTQLYF